MIIRRISAVLQDIRYSTCLYLIGQFTLRRQAQWYYLNQCGCCVFGHSATVSLTASLVRYNKLGELCPHMSRNHANNSLTQFEHLYVHLSHVKITHTQKKKHRCASSLKSSMKFPHLGLCGDARGKKKRRLGKMWGLVESTGIPKKVW